MTSISSRIKFRHLQCFLETARLQSVGKAAKNLSISQPAVSKTLRELEDELGVKLFERTGRSIRLSGYGEIFNATLGPAFPPSNRGLILWRRRVQRGDSGSELAHCQPSPPRFCPMQLPLLNNKIAIQLSKFLPVKTPC